MILRSVSFQDDIQTQSRSPKRTEDGEEIILSLRERRKATKKTVIVELADLEKEYLLILARLNLLQFDKDSSAVVGKKKIENYPEQFHESESMFDSKRYACTG